MNSDTTTPWSSSLLRAANFICDRIGANNANIVFPASASQHNLVAFGDDGAGTGAGAGHRYQRGTLQKANSIGGKQIWHIGVRTTTNSSHISACACVCYRISNS